MSSPAPRLRMESVTKRFGATQALSCVDLEVRPGEVHALIGENGAGKSTLMKVLSGAIEADEGSIWLDGKPYAPAGPQAARNAGVAMIYQELTLLPHLSVMENILLGYESTYGPFMRWGEMRRRAEQYLAAVGAEQLRPDLIAGDLSISKQQTVELARALATDLPTAGPRRTNEQFDSDRN